MLLDSVMPIIDAVSSGATQVIINIYQEAPIVGDGGMRRFAQMIREEFSNLDCHSLMS